VTSCRFDLLVWQVLVTDLVSSGQVCFKDGVPIQGDLKTSNSRNAKTQIPEMRLLQSQQAFTVGPQAEHVS